MRVLTFARHYPAYHQRKGELTHFVEKILMGLIHNKVMMKSKASEIIRELGYPENHPMYYIDGVTEYHCSLLKLHTIRAGNRWKAGDWFSPVVWSGRPYWTKQIAFAPPMEVKRVYEFDILDDEWWLDKKLVTPDLLQTIATNDGLTLDAFISWFKWPKVFDGQVIIFGDVKY